MQPKAAFIFKGYIMAAKRKTQLTEKLTDSNIQNVIKLLSGEKAITKKHACEILGITYNTARLANIINEFTEKKERDSKKRSEKRGKPAEPDEVHYIISEYVNGATLDAINKSLYRSNSFIKAILEQYSVPLRKSSPNYFEPELIPEGAMQTRFKPGETVYSSRYDSIAEVRAEIEENKKHGWVYRIFLNKDEYQCFAYQPASELASLKHLTDLGIKF